LFKCKLLHLSVYNNPEKTNFDDVFSNQITSDKIIFLFPAGRCICDLLPLHCRSWTCDDLLPYKHIGFNYGKWSFLVIFGLRTETNYLTTFLVWWKARRVYIQPKLRNCWKFYFLLFIYMIRYETWMVAKKTYFNHQTNSFRILDYAP
jgi:hypothetical protein